MKRSRAIAVVVALTLTLVAVPALGAKLKRPKEGNYTGELNGVSASVWIDIVDDKPFKALVVQEFAALESGDPFTKFIVPTTCDNGSNQPFAVSPSKDLKISNKTGKFRQELTDDQPLSNGGNIVTHQLITGKINGARASGTVEFTRTVNDPTSDFIPSCTTGQVLRWSARLRR